MACMLQSKNEHLFPAPLRLAAPRRQLSSAFQLGFSLYWLHTQSLSEPRQVPFGSGAAIAWGCQKPPPKTEPETPPSAE